MTIQPRRLRMLVAASVASWCCGAAAQIAHGARIDLPAAIRLALEQPAVRGAAHEVAASVAAAGQAGHYPNPELEYLQEGRQAGTRTTTLQLRQPIELGDKRRARLALAQGAVSLARTELALRRRETRADVIAAYYAVLVAQERQRLAGALTALARQGVDAAARRVAAGKSSPIDETRARLAAVDASTELNAATGALAIARTGLGALIGQPAHTFLLAAHDPQLLPDVKPLALLLAEAADAGAVRRARGQLSAQAAQTDVERAARMPDLTLLLGSQRDEELGRRQAVVGVSVPLPLFNRNQGNLGAALRRTDRARDELAAAQVTAAADLASAHTRYEVARKDVALLRQEVLPHADAAYALTLKGFEYGKFSVLDVLDAQRTLFQSQSRYWNALLDGWRAYADIERLAGAASTTEPYRTGEPGSTP